MSKKAVDQAIQTIFIPQIAPRGFQLRDSDLTDGFWTFAKSVGDKEERLDIDAAIPRCLRFSMGISPSVKYHWVEIEPLWRKSHFSHRDPASGGWLYDSPSDITKILELFLSALREKGFTLLDKLAEEPDEWFYDNLSAQKKLFANKDIYPTSFLEKHGLGSAEIEMVLEQLDADAENWRLSNRKSEQDLIVFSAVYGKQFERLGAHWKWDDSGYAMLLFGADDPRNHPYQINPLRQVYITIQSGQLITEDFKINRSWAGMLRKKLQ